MAVGELSRLYDRAERMATIRSFVGPKDLLALPKFDAVICMSVVHHIIRAYGLATAGEFVTALVSRVNKVLILRGRYGGGKLVDRIPARAEPRP